MEKVHVTRIAPDLAARLLAGMASAGFDPRGETTEADIPAMCQRALCIAVADDAGKSQAVCAVRVDQGVAWIDAARSFGRAPFDWSAVLLGVIEASAKGCARVEFQTKRRGLVRKARRHGYTVRGCIAATGGAAGGWIVGKDLQ
jgi:hypothetical protein